MDGLRWISQPPLRDPVALVAFEGWNDAAEAASGAVWHVLERNDSLEIAVIDYEEYADYQVTRPIIETVDGERTIVWPHTRVRAIETEGERDLVVVLGEEPRLRWRAFVEEVAAVLQQLQVTDVVTFGAFIGQVPHTLPVPVIGVTDDQDVRDRLGLLPSTYEGPTGIIGVLNDGLRQAGLSVASLWAATPHYLSGSSNPKATQALLEKASGLLQLDLDAASLDRDVTAWEQRVETAIRDSDDLSEYLAELEAEALPDGGQLVEEIEQFLRDPDA